MSRAEATFYVTGGTLSRDAPSYVERQADTDLFEGLRRGEFCYVLTARQMGKSSLMVRTAVRLQEAGTAVAILDLTQLGTNLTIDQWYYGLLASIGEQLGLRSELRRYWSEHAEEGPLPRWIGALREVVLRHCLSRVVIFVDEIDTVRSLGFSADEFFAGIREVANRQATDPEIARLTFCLLGVATPSDLIQDSRITPFNVGRRIELTDLRLEDAGPLAIGLCLGDLAAPHARPVRSRRAADRLLRRVFHWTGGHPYLTQRLCQAVAESPIAREPTLADGSTPSGRSPLKIRNPKSEVRNLRAVDCLCSALFLTEAAREKDDNLDFVRKQILKYDGDLTALLELYGRVRGGKGLPNDPADERVGWLKLAGILRVERGFLRVRNRIYARVFDRGWIASGMPDADVRRLRAAYRRGLLRAGTVAGVVLAIIAGLGITALNSTRRTEELFARQQIETGVKKLEAGDGTGLLDLVDAMRTAAHLPELRASASRIWAGWHQQYEGRLVSMVGHDQAVNEVAFSPDGKLLATASEDGTVQLWDTTNWQPHGPPIRQGSPVWRIAFSPDGKLLATRGNVENTAWLWRVDTGAPAGPPLRHNGQVLGMAFALGGRRLATMTPDSLFLWDTATCNPLRTPQNRAQAARCLAVSRDGTRVAVGTRRNGGTGRGAVLLWNAEDGSPGGVLATFPDPVTRIEFHPTENMLAIAVRSLVFLWDQAAGRPLGEPLRHSEEVQVLSFNRSGALLAARGQRATQVWDVATRRECGLPMLHAADRLPVLFRPSDPALLATVAAESIRLWDPLTGSSKESLPFGQGGFRGAAFSNDGRLLADAAVDGRVRVWDAGGPFDPAELKPVSLPEGERLALARDGRLAAIARGRMVYLVDPSTGAEQGQPLTLEHPSAEIAFSPGGRLLATRLATKGNTIRVWETGTWRPRGPALRVPPGKFAEVSMAFGDGDRILAVVSGSTVRLWEVDTGRPICAPLVHRGIVVWVAFGLSGRQLATGSPASGVQLWDVHRERPISTPVGPLSNTRAGALSGDGRVLAASYLDRHVRLFDTARMQLYVPPVPVDGLVSAITFSADGHTMATAANGPQGDRAAVQVWDVTTGQQCRPAHIDAPNPVLAFRPADGPLQIAATGIARQLRLSRPQTPWTAADLLTWLDLGLRHNSRGAAEIIPWNQWRALQAGGAR